MIPFLFRYGSVLVRRSPFIRSVVMPMVLVLPFQQMIAQCSPYPADRGRFALLFDNVSDVTIQFYAEPLRTAQPIGRYRIYTEMIGYNSFVGGLSEYHQFLPLRDVKGAAVYELIHTGPLAIGAESVTADSEWFQIVTGFKDPTLPALVWTRRSDLQRLQMTVQTWPEFFLYGVLQFICDSSRRFYTRPDDNAVIDPYLKTFEGETQPSYSMVPLRTVGKWMNVQLYSPDIFGSDDEWVAKIDSSEHPSVSVWIKYLDDWGRPTVEKMVE